MNLENVENVENGENGENGNNADGQANETNNTIKQPITEVKLDLYTSQNYIEDKEFPYDVNKQKAIASYFKNKGRPKKNIQYNYSYEGDLETYDVKKGEVIDTISLQYYRGITKEEFETLEEDRKNAIIFIEEKIDTQKTLLREAYETYKTTHDAMSVVEYNNEITSLEKQKMLLRSPVKDLISFKDSVEKRRVYFDMPFEKRVVEDLSYMFYRDFSLWKMYGKYTNSKDVHEATKRTSLVKGQVYLKNGKIARIFNDAEEENGFLSVFNVKDFVYEDTQFSSPYQAFEVSRLQELGFEEPAAKLLETRAIKFIKIKAKQYTTPMKNTKAVWKDILRNFYQQQKEYLDLLVKTDDDILIFGNTIPYLGGIGIAGQEEIVSGAWKTPNIVGEVLMELRSELKEAPETKAESFSKSVITEEEQAKAKNGAIIGTLKRMAGMK